MPRAGRNVYEEVAERKPGQPEHGANRRQPVLSVRIREPAAAASRGSRLPVAIRHQHAMKLCSILFVLLLTLGCAPKPCSAGASLAVQAEPPEPTDVELARIVRNRSLIKGLPHTTEATDTELAQVRMQVPKLRTNMDVAEVFEALGISRLLRRVHWLGQGSEAAYFARFYLRLGHTYSHTPLTVIIAPGGQVIGVRFEHIKWPAG